MGKPCMHRPPGSPLSMLTNLTSVVLVLLTLLPVFAAQSQNAPLSDQDVSAIASKVENYRNTMPMDRTIWSWCKIPAVRRTMADSATTCAPWKTAELPPDTGSITSITYIQPFEVFTDFVVIPGHTVFKQMRMTERFLLRKNTSGYWVVIEYSITDRNYHD